MASPMMRVMLQRPVIGRVERWSCSLARAPGWVRFGPAGKHVRPLLARLGPNPIRPMIRYSTMRGTSSSGDIIAPLPPSRFGNNITMLTIDGGGMRGLIVLEILKCLEEELQNLSGNNDVGISDYLDVIAGTSTGGLIATMLAAPKDKNAEIIRPKYTVKEIMEYYEDLGPKIFNSGRDIGHLIWGPKYDGKALHRAIKAEMCGLMLSDTVTSILVPTFDVSLKGPITFSSFKRDPHPVIDQLLSDVCIATTAAPTYFPPWQVTSGPNTLNLVDGGMIANNPTMLAIQAVQRQRMQGNKDFVPVVNPNPDVPNKSDGFERHLILSIGTEYNRGHYSLDEIKNKGKVMWALPAVDILRSASDFSVNLNVAILFQNQGDPENYLRIQPTDGTFGEKRLPLDAASKEDIKLLKSIGTRLLDKRLGRTSKVSWQFTPVNGGITNRQALKDFARKLYDEREHRIRNYDANVLPEEHQNEGANEIPIDENDYLGEEIM